MSGKATKGESYKFAFSQMKSAIEQEFYLEAVTLAESVISDRLLSQVSYFAGDKVKLRTTFSDLLKRWKTLDDDRAWGFEEGETGIRHEWPDLHEAINDWRKKRNKVVHSACKSIPDTATIEVGDFKAGARVAAEEGHLLARAICDWHKKQIG